MLNATLLRPGRRPGGLRALAARITAAVAEFRTTPGPLVDVDQLPAGEVPEVEDIEAAAATYFRAADAARTADRAKRAARKVLDRVPVGVVGAWRIDRIPSARQTVDLEAVRATYKRYGLGPVPMRPSAPSLRVVRVQLPAPTDAAVIGGQQ